MKIVNEQHKRKVQQKKYNVPIIGHFADRSIRFDSILQASEVTKVPYHMIFECAVGKIKKAHNTYWEFENGVDYLRYKAFYIRHQENYKRLTGFNG